MAEHNDLGRKGEALAARFLEKEGCFILEKNWRHGKAEVDLIVMDAGELVLVEIKTRSTDYFGSPEESVTRNKQKLLCEAANAYLELNDLDCEIRFDIISVISNKGEETLHHIRGAFYPYSSELD